MATPFKLRSQGSSYKMMGSSPVRRDTRHETTVGSRDENNKTTHKTDRAITTDKKGRVRKTVEEFKKVNKGVNSVLDRENFTTERTKTTKLRKSGEKKKTVDVRGDKTGTYKYDKKGKLKKTKYSTVDESGNKTIKKTNAKTGKTTTRVNKKGFQISDIFGGKKVKNAEKPKSNASGFGNPNAKTYVYNDPRFKTMGRDKNGNKIKNSN